MKPLLATFRRIVAGDLRDLDELPRLLIPVLQPIIGHYLYRYRAGLAGRDPRSEVEDVVQDVLVALFKDNGAKLATWDESRGSPETFLRKVASSMTITHVRRRREELSPTSSAPDPGEDDGEHRMLSVDELNYLLGHLREVLTDMEQMAFDLWYVEELSAKEVATALGTSAEAVNSMRYRIGKKIAFVVAKLDPELPRRSGKRGAGA